MTSRTVQHLFTLLSVFLVWQADIEKHLRLISVKVGILPGSLLENAIVDIGIPIILISALSFFNWIYDVIKRVFSMLINYRETF